MNKRRILLLLALAACAVLIFALSSAMPTVEAKGTPLADPERGLVYNGLPANDAACKNAFRVPVSSKAKARCTHGPDVAPKGFDVKKRVAPITQLSAAPARGNLGSAPSVPKSTNSIVCDGDGNSGQRVQVIYARASNVADNYNTYLASFRTWVAGMDAIYNNSAAQTGGSRHIRFVHDANCNPVIPNVTLSPTGDDNFVNTIVELEARGYNRSDRKYLVFMDAHVYCGISEIAYDDQPGANNANNSGDSFGRIDAGCWSDVIPAHELMHQLGGVQISAAHSSGEWHCFDGYDVMCRPTNGTALQLACPNIAQGNSLDCNHDDYYHTNPPAGSYLATHWNSANSQFLIMPRTNTKRR